MRLVMCNWTSRRAGGVESYLARVIGALRDAGHEVALAAEERDGERPPIDETSLPALPGAIRAWRPDLIINHGLRDAALEAQILAIAPAMLFAHSYYGTCIGGHKAYTFPRVAPCDRTLGWGCLLRYYPGRTGGLSPVTLARLWRLQRARQAMLGRYRSILVFSDHMRDEYQRHGCGTVRVLPFPMEAAAVAEPRHGGGTRLLFVGRCDPLKGGAHLIHAVRQLDDAVTLTIVGDGPARPAWEQAAASLGLRVQFTGWADDVTAAYQAADLLVVPSLWPEPFGQVGLEAARFGVPSVAFPTGGIPQWLREGVNGLLAPAPADATALAETIHAALAPTTYRALSAGALSAVDDHPIERHIAALVDHLAEAA